MEKNSCHHDHDIKTTCNCSSFTTASQSLDELEFVRGIWYAAQYGDVDRVRKLIKHVNDRDAAGYTALHYAARNGHLDVCKVLIENRAEIDAVTKSGKASALHRACSSGKQNVIEYLLNKNADVFLQDADGKTALHRAMESNHMHICKILLNKAPSLKSAPDTKGLTLLEPTALN